MKSKKQLFNFYSIEEMQNHAKEHYLSLIIYKNSVYDISTFIYNHPGGFQIISKYINQSVDQVIFNNEFHKHSPQIISQLQNYLYGYIIKSSFSPLTPKCFMELAIKSEKSPTITSHKQKKINSTLKFLREDAETKLSNIGIPKISPKKMKSSVGDLEIEEVPDDTESSIKVPRLKYRFKSTNQLY